MVYTWEQLKERTLKLCELSERIMVFDNPNEIRIYNENKTRCLLYLTEDCTILDFQHNFIKNLTFNEMYQLLNLLK